MGEIIRFEYPEKQVVEKRRKDFIRSTQRRRVISNQDFYQITVSLKARTLSRRDALVIQNYLIDHFRLKESEIRPNQREIHDAWTKFNSTCEVYDAESLKAIIILGAYKGLLDRYMACNLIKTLKGLGY